MTGEQKSFREKLGAIFFAFVMVTSVVAIGSAAFAGTAAAVPTDATVNSPNDVDGDGSIEVQNGATIRVTIDTADSQVTFALDDNGDLADGTNGANTSASVSISDGGSGDLDSADDTITTDIIVTPSSGTFSDGADLELVASSGGSVSGTGDITPQIVTVDDSAPSTQSANSVTADTDNDGNVDEITVDFNEQIIDANSELSASEFALSTGTVDSVSTGASSNDDAIKLQVSGVSGTGATPSVESADNGNTLDFEDEAGNTLSVSSTNTLVSSTDGAAPVLLSAVKQSGSNEVELTFSEAVEDGGDNDEDSIAAADLNYADNNGDGASGPLTVVDDGTNDGVFTVLTTGAVTTGDIGTDQIAPFDGKDSNSGGASDGIQDRSSPDVGAITNSVVIKQQSLAGGTAAGAEFAVGGDGSADVVAGSANESLGEIKLRDDPSNSDAAFAGETKLTFPEGVTINTSASSLNTNTVITSQNDGVDVDSVDVTNNDRTITISHSGTSNNGEEIRIASGSVVLSVDASQFDTTGTSTSINAELNTFSGKADMSGFLVMKTPTVSTDGPDAVSINTDGQGLTGSTNDVEIASGTLAQSIEGTDEALIGNQTEIQLTLESGTGVSWDTSSSVTLGSTNLDTDNDAELDANNIGVTSSTVSVPVVDAIDGQNLNGNNVQVRGIAVDANGSATDTNLNVSVTAPSPDAGAYVVDSSPGGETLNNFVTVDSPSVDYTGAEKSDVVVGATDQTNLLSGNAIELDGSTSSISSGSTVVISTNRSDVNFVSTGTVSASNLDSESDDDITSLSVNNAGDVVVEIGDESAGGGSGAFNNPSYDIIGENGENNIGLEVASDVPDGALVEVQATIDDTVEIADTSERIQVQRPNTNLNADSNVTVDTDADGVSNVEFNGGDGNGVGNENAIEITSDQVGGQVAENTFVNVTLEDDTGVTFDTSVTANALADSPGAGTGTGGQVDVSDDGSNGDDIRNVTITEKTLAIGIISDNGGLANGETIRVDELFLNATGSATNTTLSVTTNTGDNKVTTQFGKQIITNSVNPSNLFADADTGQTDSNGDATADPDVTEANYGTSSNDEAQVGEQSAETQPRVDSAVTSEVYVVDGSSPFGSATVNLNVVQTPDGASGQSLNTTSLTTDSNGLATFEFTTGDTDGTYVVNASTDAGGVNITYVVQPGEVDAVTVTPIENGIAGASNTDLSEASLFVNATDANGNPVQAGPTVSLSADNVGADDVTAFDNLASDGTGTTNSDSLQDGEFTIDSSDGSSVVDVTSSQVEDVTITVSTGSNSDTGTVTLFDQVGGIDLSLNETSVAVDDTVTADATITEADGTVIEVPDVTVNYDDNNNGNTTFETNADSESATTNANGVASINVTAEQNGTSTIDASSNLRTDSATLTIEGQATESASVTFNDQSVQNGTEEVTVASANYTLADGSEGDYVVVMHVVNDDGSISSPVGASSDQTGSASDITVDLNDTSAAFEDGDALDTLTENTTLRAMLHETSSDSAFGPSLGLATDDADITVTPESPIDGPAGDFDTDADGDISIGELGDAGEAFAQGELTIAELGAVGQQFAS